MGLIRQLRHTIIQSMPHPCYCAATNLKSKLQRRKHQIKPVGKRKFLITDSHHSLWITERQRHSRYRRGIEHAVHELARIYHLQSMDVLPGGVFIDCGANVGELGLWARAKGLDYHAFEPEPDEARCCDLNNYGGAPDTRQYGLWNQTGEMKLYSKPESADSSLIEFKNYSQVRRINTLTLDDYVSQRGINRIEVLKVEAEGGEPEVLQGARNTLSRCKYITVDCGPERGTSNADTLVQVREILFEAGFQMKGTNLTRMTVLYENQSFACTRVA